MCSAIRTIRSTGAYSEQIRKIAEILENADAVLIGAGAGLSTSAGFTYSGERFHRYFADFIEKYHFTDIFSGGFFPFPTREEYWAYFSRHVWINRYMDPPKPVYRELLELVRDREYFVLSTNTDHCFLKAGFEGSKVFCTQGDLGLFQCSVPCCTKTYSNMETIREMVEKQKDMRIPPELLPVCPECGKPLRMHLRNDYTFVEGPEWKRMAVRYEMFLRRHAGDRILLLELGVGYNTPGIIKYPFWRMTAGNPKWVYASINMEDAVCPEQIGERAILVNHDIGGAIRDVQDILHRSGKEFKDDYMEEVTK
ncbi:MAG: Sir2 silent information regulator family NAD-dependent deacetylase [Clostridiales bacterium]|nr:Sir2 silent information regulator family NAD-dependent deacetylase [Clostridiales bacterium]